MFVLILLSICLCASASKQYFAPEQASEHFEEFISKFDKQYTDDHEKALRFEIFKDNLKNINRMNKESPHAEFGVTRFADITPEEFGQRHTGLRRDAVLIDCAALIFDEDIVDPNAPESFDWRKEGVVTKVKNQGVCASGYAFSVTGNIESQIAIQQKTLIELSEQQIVDCDNRSLGCYGGLMSASIISLKEVGGLMTESDYPYKASFGICALDKSKVAVKLVDCISYRLGSQEKVKQVLFKNGPISIAIDAVFLQFYSGGIFPDTFCTLPPNHAVLLVGYGTENDQPYWIVKNSWGEDFGEGGYFRLHRSEDVKGACGMLNVFMVTAVVE